MPVTLVAVLAAWANHDVIDRVLVAHAVRVDAMSAIFLTLLVGVWVAEQLSPARPEWNYRVLTEGVFGVARLGRDLVYLLFVTQFTALLLKWAAPRVSALVPSRGLWPTQAPLVARLVLAFFLVELFAYWVHRAAHRFPLLWRFHATHHVITELSGLKSLRVHPVDNLCFYVGRTVPLLFLGASVDEMATATYLGGVLGILSHANLELKEGWLGWVVNFPRYHSVHHSAVVSESNSNFGCHTVVWDRLFRTFRASPEQPLTIGVEPVGPRSLWAELVGPFYRPAP
jgi:sterol desaturase/sphingolipid hydroxylase (fatty acid hydroxylase superfamily)